jgi:hypothetical protein
LLCFTYAKLKPSRNECMASVFQSKSSPYIDQCFLNFVGYADGRRPFRAIARSSREELQLNGILTAGLVDVADFSGRVLLGDDDDEEDGNEIGNDKDTEKEHEVDSDVKDKVNSDVADKNDDGDEDASNSKPEQPTGDGGEDDIQEDDSDGFERDSFTPQQQREAELAKASSDNSNSTVGVSQAEDSATPDSGVATNTTAASGDNLTAGDIGSGIDGASDSKDGDAGSESVTEEGKDEDDDEQDNFLSQGMGVVTPQNGTDGSISDVRSSANGTLPNEGVIVPQSASNDTLPEASSPPAAVDDDSTDTSNDGNESPDADGIDDQEKDKDDDEGEDGSNEQDEEDGDDDKKTGDGEQEDKDDDDDDDKGDSDSKEAENEDKSEKEEDDEDDKEDSGKHYVFYAK